MCFTFPLDAAFTQNILKEDLTVTEMSKYTIGIR